MHAESKPGDHLSDVADIRARARARLESGAVTPSYAADLPRVLKLLNEALATEIVCTLRYRAHYFRAGGVLAEAIKKEFLQHALEEQEHADQIAERITQLGGEPDFNPETLTRRSHAEYRAGKTLVEMLEADLIAERIAIESYREIILFLGEQDPTSRRLMEEILAKEEEHAEELRSMLEDVRTVLGQAGRKKPADGG
jgi:bacterioferritin